MWLADCRVLLWLDDDVENDPNCQVDDVDEEDDGEREAKWRTERLEREKFLEEHKVDALVIFSFLSLCDVSVSICRWMHNWKSAQVVNSHLVCDPTIRQPGFDLPRQQWYLLKSSIRLFNRHVRMQAST